MSWKLSSTDRVSLGAYVVTARPMNSRMPSLWGGGLIMHDNIETVNTLTTAFTSAVRSAQIVPP